MTRRHAMRESDLQRSVVQWLRYARPHCVWFACPNGVKSDPRSIAIAKGLGLRPGVSDLVFAWGGGAAFVELKRPPEPTLFGRRPGGRQTTAQQDFAADCDRLGIPHIVADTLDDVHDFLARLGLIGSPSAGATSTCCPALMCALRTGALR